MSIIDTRPSVERIVPPKRGNDVCPICRDRKEPGHDECENCERNADILARQNSPVSLYSLYTKPSALRDAVTDYKNPTCPNRLAHQRTIASLAEVTIANATVTHAAWDAICVVPSSRHDNPHPLHELIDNRMPTAFGQLDKVLARNAGTLDHQRPNPTGYIATRPLNGVRLMLIDDVYTTGARSQSAAHAIEAAGGTVTGIAVIGRRINPNANDDMATWWQKHVG